MNDLRKFTEEANSLSIGLASSNVFLLKRSIDLSLLRQGFHIPPEFPRFDRDGLCFEFENGVREAVRLDRHLKKV